MFRQYLSAGKDFHLLIRIQSECFLIDGVPDMFLENISY